MRAALCLLTLAMAACSPPAEPRDENAAASPAASPATTAPTATGAAPSAPEPPDDGVRDIDYLGRWTAADGRALVVTDLPQGGMTLELTDADGRTRALPGSVTAEGLRFMRDDEAESAVIVADPADPTRRCLSIDDTEVYCR